MEKPQVLLFSFCLIRKIVVMQRWKNIDLRTEKACCISIDTASDLALKMQGKQAVELSSEQTSNEVEWVDSYCRNMLELISSRQS